MSSEMYIWSEKIPNVWIVQPNKNGSVQLVCAPRKAWLNSRATYWRLLLRWYQRLWNPPCWWVQMLIWLFLRSMILWLVFDILGDNPISKLLIVMCSIEYILRLLGWNVCSSSFHWRKRTCPNWLILSISTSFRMLWIHCWRLHYHNMISCKAHWSWIGNLTFQCKEAWSEFQCQYVMDVVWDPNDGNFTTSHLMMKRVLKFLAITKSNHTINEAFQKDTYRGQTDNNDYQNTIDQRFEVTWFAMKRKVGEKQHIHIHNWWHWVSTQRMMQERYTSFIWS